MRICRNAGLFIAVFILGATPSLADVDVIVTGGSVIDPATGQPTTSITVAQGEIVTIEYEWDITTQVFAAEPNVVKKVETVTFPALFGAVYRCRLGIAGAGDLKKQDGTTVHSHDPAIIGGAAPADACSVGVRVAVAAACPAAPVDQAALAHVFERMPIIGANKYCKHFIGQDDTLEVKVAGGAPGQVQENGFPAPAIRNYDVCTPAAPPGANDCAWDTMKKKVNLPGSKKERVPGVPELATQNIPLGIYTVTAAVDVEVEGATDIDLSNNVFEFQYTFVVVEQIPTLPKYGAVALALLLLGGLTVWTSWRFRERRTRF